jgi:glycosyltransferase involved in cell wall biosynthesis
MEKLSVCMIVKDEEDILEKGVTSLEGLYDELIILDTGSLDHTKLIATSLGAKVHDYTWIDDFSDARTVAQSFAKHSYILVWDADWVLSPESKKLFLKLREQNFHHADHVCFNWVNEFDYDSLEKYRSELRSFIYNKTVSTWKHPIHEDLVAIDPNHEIITWVEKGVDVYHYKDKTRRQRYEQNIFLIKKTLLSSSLTYEERARQLALLGQAYFYDKNYQLALEAYLQSLEHTKKAPSTKLLAIYVIEKAVLSALGIGDIAQAKLILHNHKKTIISNPRYWLLMADIAVTEKHFDQAIKWYKQFQNSPAIFELIEIDSKRYKDHPADMIHSLQHVKN